MMKIRRMFAHHRWRFELVHGQGHTIGHISRLTTVTSASESAAGLGRWSLGKRSCLLDQEKRFSSLQASLRPCLPSITFLHSIFLFPLSPLIDLVAFSVHARAFPHR
jgi:hypothetical protein